MTLGGVPIDVAVTQCSFPVFNIWTDHHDGLKSYRELTGNRLKAWNGTGVVHQFLFRMLLSSTVPTVFVLSCHSVLNAISIVFWVF